MSELAKRNTDIEATKRNLRRTGSLRDLLNTKSGPTVLLCDVSGSMNTLLRSAANKRRIDALREAVEDLPKIPTIAFGFHYGEGDNGGVCRFLPNQDTLPDMGIAGTPLDAAFELAKFHGYTHTVVVTDGEPNSASAALKEAAGLRVDAIYVGDPPIPQFLIDLCNQTGGSFSNVSIETPKELGSKILALIEGKVG